MESTVILDQTPQTSQQFIIQTTGLGKYYQKKKVTAVKELNLQIPRNSICGFLGPNGAGKSTAIKLLLGLTRPSWGSGQIFGLDIVRESIEIRQRIGYLGQSPHFYDHMSARETLRFALHFFYSGPSVAIEEQVAEALDLVGLTEKADRPIRGFSGGEKQRLGIAQAQIHHPELLILDEPAAALDPFGRRDVLAIMQRLRQHTTIFYSTHLLHDVQEVSDMVVILHKGEQISQAPIEALLAQNSSPHDVFAVIVQGDDLDGTRRRLEAQPWITSVKEVREPKSHQTTWQISVTDETIAQARLLALIAESGTVTIVEFGRKKQDLQDIFVDLIERKNDEHA